MASPHARYWWTTVEWLVGVIMSKLESIRQIIKESQGVIWDEQTVKREHLRREGEYYWVVGLQVFPQEPILNSSNLEVFSDRLTQSIIPVGPMNITKCYEYAETRRDVIKTATAYFIESIEEPGEERGLERRITVSMYPCQAMAKEMGVRGTIDVGHFECPSLCKQASKCGFRARSDGFFYDASR